MKKIIPLSLRKTHNLIKRNVSVETIIEMSDSIVENDMTLNQLINKVSVALLHTEQVNKINDMTLGFRQNLLNKIKETIYDRYSTEDRKVKYFDEEGQLVVKYFPHIVGEKDPERKTTFLTKDPKRNQPYLTLKGSEKIIDNNSKEILELYSSTENRVRTVDISLLKLYSALEYEKRKNVVKQDKDKFKKYLIDLANETHSYCGYVFNDHRKLDRSSRDYSLARFGHALQYGDAFQKWMIQPSIGYSVTELAKNEAIAYLQNEFKTKDWEELYKESIELIEVNLALLPDWGKGNKTNFSITTKQLGKACQVISLVNNLIEAPIGSNTNELVCLDFTNSGGIMFANQFGDEKFLTISNLIGDKKKDAHQAVADFLRVSRDDAKKVMVGSNHGARLTETTLPIANEVFGETYKGINALAEYGKELLFNGVTHLKLKAPDGVVGVFHGYTLNGELSIDGIKVNAVLPFSPLKIGKNKGYSFGVINQHMSDAFVVRYIRKRLITRGIPHLTILDAFYVPAGTTSIIKELAYDALEELEGWFDGELTRIEKETGIPMENRPIKRTIPVERTGNVF